jgi:hypothetical protein
MHTRYDNKFLSTTKCLSLDRMPGLGRESSASILCSRERLETGKTLLPITCMVRLSTVITDRQDDATDEG